ncbi:MAG: pilin, partial [Patescibacteria group bacterium]
MKLNNKNLIFFVVLFALFAFPAFAQDFVGPVREESGLLTCGFEGGKLCTICDIWALADKVIKFLLFKLATPILIIVLIAGGFIYLTSGGNPKKTETAKGLITSAIFGIVIAFAAWLIVDTILKTLVNEDFTIAWQEIEECPDPLEPEIPELSK